MGAFCASNAAIYASGVLASLRRWAAEAEKVPKTANSLWQTGVFTCDYSRGSRFYAVFRLTLHNMYYHGFVYTSMHSVSFMTVCYHMTS